MPKQSQKNPIGFTAKIVPKKAQRNPDFVPKQAQNTVTPKRLKNKRKTVTADTGTEGDNSKRYQALKKEIIGDTLRQVSGAL